MERLVLAGPREQWSPSRLVERSVIARLEIGHGDIDAIAVVGRPHEEKEEGYETSYSQ